MARSERKQAARLRFKLPGGLDAHRPLFERLLFVLALLGVLVTVHLFIQQGRGFDRGCLGFSDPGAVSAMFDCELVTESKAGTLFGISNALWGLLFYAVVAGLSTRIASLPDERRLWLKQMRAGLIGVGFLYSLYLTYVQYGILQQLCLLCLLSAALVTLLFLVQAVYLFKPTDAPEAALQWKSPVRDGRLYAVLAGLVLVLVGADFAYFGGLDAPAAQGVAEPAPQPAQPVADARGEACVFDPQKQPVEDYAALIREADPVRGHPDAAVTFIEYFDPNCPHCKTLHPLMKAILARFGGQVRLVYKPMAIWDFSVAQSAALFAAARDGKFDAMLDRQFALQQPGGLSMDELKQAARDVGMDPVALEQRLRGGVFNGLIRENNLQAQEIGVTGVPSVLINGRFVASASRTLDCFEAFIQAEGGARDQ